MPVRGIRGATTAAENTADAITEATEELLGIPEGVRLVAYLCVGYPVEFRPKPMLEEVGWKHRQPLRELVFQDQWDVRSLLFK